MAVFLNVVIPGLGCAYLGRWGYALLFVIWAPLAYFGSLLVSSFLVGLMPIEWRWVITILLLFAIRIRLLYDLIFTPYKLAIEHNAKVDHNLEISFEVAHSIT